MVRYSVEKILYSFVPCLTDFLFQLTEGVCAEALVMHEQFCHIIIDVCHAMFNLNGFLIFFFFWEHLYNLGNLLFKLFFLQIEPA